jgi:acylphosphatase
VFFRASTKEQADLLGLDGWVRNLPDGRVEVYATGSKAVLEEFHSWLRKGPNLAIVDAIECDNGPELTVHRQGFRITR